MRNKKHELEAALEGTFTAEQRWLLGRELQQMEWLEQQVAAMEQETEQRVMPFSEPLRRLTAIPGADRITAWTILAEVGADARAFEDARHLASWAGLCPGNRESGGKRMSGRTRKANCYVKRALCQAAWAASHTKNTYLSAFYRRLCGRKGAPKAVMALAHHLITIVYHVLARQEEYVELGGDYHDRRNKTKVVNRLVKRLAVLGYEVTLNPSRPLEFDEEVHAVPPWISSPALDGSAPTITSSKPKRGRPCKCTERGIICIHGRLPEAKSLIDQPPTRVEFS